MPRPVILFTNGWADLPLEDLAAKAAEWGYAGLELSCWGDHFEVQRALSEADYAPGKLDLLARHDLQVPVLSNHRTGQAVCDPIDHRHQALLARLRLGRRQADRRPPAGRRGDGRDVPGRAEARRRRRQRVHRLAALVVRRRLSRADAGDRRGRLPGLRQALGARSWTWPATRGSGSRSKSTPGRSRSTCTRRRWCSTPCDGREEFGFTFDPSHLHWQGVDPVEFVRRFPRPHLPRPRQGRGADAQRPRRGS